MDSTSASEELFYPPDATSLTEPVLTGEIDLPNEPGLPDEPDLPPERGLPDELDIPSERLFSPEPALPSKPALPAEVLAAIVASCILTTQTITPALSVTEKAKSLALVNTAFLDWTIAACKARIELYYVEVKTKIREVIEEYGNEVLDEVPEHVEESLDNVCEWVDKGEKEIGRFVRRLECVRSNIMSAERR